LNNVSLSWILFLVIIAEALPLLIIILPFKYSTSFLIEKRS
jgi:hypothetical protein